MWLIPYSIAHSETNKMFVMADTLRENYRASNVGVKFYEKKTVNFSDSSDIDHKQAAIDFTLQLSTMDACIDRVNKMLTLFKGRVASEKEQFGMLRFLRKKY